MSERVGQVAELWRYPVQSLRGERAERLDFLETGAVGDRGYCIVDDTNEGGTAARPQWKRIITWAARYLSEPAAGAALPKVAITFPDGTEVVSDDARIDDLISERLGRRACLTPSLADGVRRPYESSACHLLTSATLKALSAAYPQGRFVPERFRPNVVLDCGETSGFIESGWLGTDLTLGAVTLNIDEHCVRCALTTRPQGDLAMDPGILHTAQQFNENHVGVYGAVRHGGLVAMGDAATR